MLERTKFFEIHGPPKHKEPPREAVASTPAGQESQGKAAEFLFSDRGGTEETVPDEPMIIDLVENADYILQEKFYYSRDAFNIFYRHLNDAPPATPKNSEDCEALFKAYALALCYAVTKLQNEIIGALQTFYSQNTIPMTNLIFVINRFETDCPLYQYLMAQAAFEMSCDWRKFREENKEVMRVFGSGESEAVESLFEAVMVYTKPLDSADPAKHKRSWRL